MTGMWGEAVRSPLKLLEGMLSTCRVFSRSCNITTGIGAGSDLDCCKSDPGQSSSLRYRNSLHSRRASFHFCATLNSLASLRALAWAVLLARRGRCSLAASAKTWSLSRNLRAAGRPAAAVTQWVDRCDRRPDSVALALLCKAASPYHPSLQHSGCRARHTC